MTVKDKRLSVERPGTACKKLLLTIYSHSDETKNYENTERKVFIERRWIN